MKDILVFLTMSFIFLNCTINPTILEENTPDGLYGNLILKNGEPAKDAIVKVYRNKSKSDFFTTHLKKTVLYDTLLVDSALTNNEGRYLFEDLPNGVYNISSIFSLNKDTLCSINLNLIHDSVTYAGIDTLYQPGYINGQVSFSKNDRSGVLIYIPGTSYLSHTDKDGKFNISNIPIFQFYTIAYSYPKYLLVKDSNITVTSNDTTFLNIKILTRDPNSLVPPPNKIHIHYDSILGAVSLSWNRIIHPNFSGYLVYRKDSLLLTKFPKLISGDSLVTDTTFNDFIFKEFSDTNPTIFQYHIKSQDNKNNQSDYSDPVFIKTYPPQGPDNPFPKDGDTGVNYILNLVWSPISTNAKKTAKYTVFLDTINPPQKIVAKDIRDTSILVSQLYNDKYYYWSVYSSTHSIRARSNIWHFKTFKNVINWKLNLSDDIQIHTSPIIDQDGTISIACDSKLSYTSTNTYAINPNGTIKWESNAKAYYDLILSNEGTIYFAEPWVNNNPSYFYALGSDGSIIWKYLLPNWGLFYGIVNYNNTSLTHDGNIITSLNGTLLCINSKGGLEWELPFLPLNIYPIVGLIGPSISLDGTIYIHTVLQKSNLSKLFAISPDGKIKWDILLNDTESSTPSFLPIIGRDGTIYVCFNRQNKLELAAITPDGSKKWATELSNISIKNIIIGKDETIYVLCPSVVNSVLYAIDLNGNKKWELEFKNLKFSNISLGKDETIYAAYSTLDTVNDNRIIKLIGINTNKIKTWECPLELLPKNNEIYDLYLTIGNCNVIYVCASYRNNYNKTTGTLYSITTRCDGLADSPWPMYRHDPQHTGRQH